MREHKRDKERLEHILDAIKVIENGLATYSKEELLDTPLFYYGLVKQVEIIGEAARMLTDDFKNANQDVPWLSIANMRNFLVHEYFQVDSEVVFSVIHNEIPELQNHISRYLSEIDWEAWEKEN